MSSHKIKHIEKSIDGEHQNDESRTATTMVTGHRRERKNSGSITDARTT